MKNNLFRIALFTLPIIAFNVLFFLIGGSNHPTSVWIAYTCIHLAWIICLGTPAMVSKLDHPVNAMVLSSLTLSFFAIQMVVGIIIILISPSSHTWVLIIEVLLFLVFLIALIATAWVNNMDAGLEKERLANREVAQQHSLRVKMLLSKAQDTNLRQQLSQCYDRLMRTPIKNSPAVEQLNYDLDGVLNELERVVAEPTAAAPLVEKLKQLIEQREQVLKFMH
jgi:hypothetical protein